MGERIAYFDRIKALAIFFVVYGHVCLFILNNETALFRFQNMFCMPLFFYVSGFFTRQPDSMESFVRMLLGKCRQLMVPFVSLGVLMSVVFDGCSLNSLLFDTGHNGLWFLFVLFIFYAIAGAISVVNTHIKGGISSFCLIACMVWLFFVFFQMTGKSCTTLMSFFSFPRIVHNFPFFVFGMVVGNIESLHALIKRKLCFSVALPVFLSLAVLKYLGIPIPNSMIAFALIPVFSYLLSQIPEHSWVDDIVLYVGRRTMDVYLLHFIFLNGLVSIEWGSSYILVDFLLSILLIACSVCMGELIRRNRLTALLLLGIYKN